MATFAYSGTNARRPDGQRRTHGRLDGRGGGGAAARADAGHADHAGQGQGRRPPPRPSARSARRSSAKNLAVFTRQFSVMIDAGLPLVQCLDILGVAGGGQELRGGHPADAQRRRGRRVAGRRDAQASEDLRPAVHQHGRGRRSGRHPRHDPQAARDLYREGGEAEGPGEVGDDLPDRGHRHRRRSSSASFSGRSSRPSRSCSPASAPNCRCRRASSSGLSKSLVSLLPVHGRRPRSRSDGRSARYYATDNGRRVVDGTMLKMPMLGDILRKIAVARFCRTLATLISSGVPILDGLDITARTSGNAIIEDAIMVTRKSIERGETICRAAEGDGGVSADGGADDRRRRGDRRARHDAGEDRRLLRRGSRHGGRRPADAARTGDDRRSSASSSAASSSRCTCRSST